MKTKVIATILGIVFCAAFLCATHASAESGWYSCTVDQVGPGGGKVYIMVSDTANTPEFTKKWCKCPDEFKNQMLAVALTAMTNDQTIQIYVDPSIRYPEISRMYLQK
jgi:hypothetical protein